MYVVEMSVSIVKLDYDMSKAFFNSPKARQVVRAVVSMAHGMELKVVAEGIEQKYQVELLRQFQCDYVQGYYFSKPIPPEDFVQFMIKERM